MPPVTTKRRPEPRGPLTAPAGSRIRSSPAAVAPFPSVSAPDWACNGSASSEPVPESLPEPAAALEHNDIEAAVNTLKKGDFVEVLWGGGVEGDDDDDDGQELWYGTVKSGPSGGRARVRYTHYRCHDCGQAHSLDDDDVYILPVDDHTAYYAINVVPELPAPKPACELAAVVAPADPDDDVRTASAAEAAVAEDGASRRATEAADAAAAVDAAKSVRELAAVARAGPPFEFSRDTPAHKLVAEEIGLTSAQAAGEEAITPEQVHNFGVFYYHQCVADKKLNRTRYKGGHSKLLGWLHTAVSALVSEETEALPRGHFMLPQPQNRSDAIKRFHAVLEKIGAVVKWHGGAACGPEHVESFAVLRHEDLDFRCVVRPAHRACGCGAPLYLRLLAKEADELKDVVEAIAARTAAARASSAGVAAARVAAARVTAAATGSTERELAAVARAGPLFEFSRNTPTNKLVAKKIELTSAQAAGEEAITPEQVYNFGDFYYLQCAEKNRTRYKRGNSNLLTWLHSAVNALLTEETEALPPGHFMLPQPQNRRGSIKRFHAVLEKIGAGVEWHGGATCGPEHVEKFAVLRHDNRTFQRLLRNDDLEAAYVRILTNAADVLAKAAVPPAGHFLLPAPQRGALVSFPKLLQHLGVAVEPHGGAFCAVEHVEKFANLPEALMHTYRLQDNSPPFIKVLHEKVAGLANVHVRARSINLGEDDDEMSVPTPVAASADDHHHYDDGGMQGSANKRHRTEAAATRRDS